MCQPAAGSLCPRRGLTRPLEKQRALGPGQLDLSEVQREPVLGEEGTSTTERRVCLRDQPCFEEYLCTIEKRDSRRDGPSPFRCLRHERQGSGQVARQELEVAEVVARLESELLVADRLSARCAGSEIDTGGVNTAEVKEQRAAIQQDAAGVDRFGVSERHDGAIMFHHGLPEVTSPLPEETALPEHGHPGRCSPGERRIAFGFVERHQARADVGSELEVTHHQAEE